MPTYKSTTENLQLSSAHSDGVETPRLVSLDALRGFDMFWIIGGMELVRVVAEQHSWLNYECVMHLTEHPEWNGYTPWDQIFPLFMFVAGVAMPFSFAARIKRGDSAISQRLRVVRRGLLLVFLGMIFNGLLNFDFAEQRYPSVLGRIGLSYMLAGLVVLNTKVRGQIIWIVGILLGYWMAMKWVPVPGFGAGDWDPGKTLCGHVDRLLLPGTLYEKVRDPEGVLSTVPAVATVLMGALAGAWLRRSEPGGHMKTLGLLAAGGVSLLLAGLWSGWFSLEANWYGWFPINKNLWTSSFVLYTSGWSLILLALFYLVIDVWGFRRLAFVFVVIGMNAITIYMIREFVDFPAIGEVVFGRTRDLKKAVPSLFEAREVILAWLLLFVLYRNRIFLRV